jgi:DNA polymerase III epsilon subunit-like protein
LTLFWYCSIVKLLMAYLILDTETNGLDNSLDFVIEVGAVIAELNVESNLLEYVASYQSLIKLDKMLDDKITELTGITVDELSKAPNRIIVQEQWADFLSKYNITHVLGHSLSFDTGFLKSNGFFLPDCEYVDTLDLTKILAPDFKAINLDYINKSQDLDKYFPKPAELNNLQHHRALFDSFLAAGLFNYLFTRLNNSNRNTDFILCFELFMNQKLNLNESIHNPIPAKNKFETLSVNVLKNDINVSTQSIFIDLYNNQNTLNALSGFYLKVKDIKNNDFKKIILSIWFGVMNANLLGKISLNGTLEKKFYDLVVDSISEKNVEDMGDFTLVNPELIIVDNKELTTINYSSQDLLDYLEMYSQLNRTVKLFVGEIKLNQQQLLSSLRLITNTAYYSMKVDSATFEQSDLINNLKSLKNNLKEILSDIKTNNKHTSLEVLLTKYLIKSIEILDRNELSFFFHDNDVKVYSNIDFDLKDYMKDVIHKSQKVVTSLTPELYQDFSKLFDLEGVKSIEYGPEILINQNDNILEALKADTTKVKIVFIGKSANLKTLPAKLKIAGIDYIDVSNSGSATKILSRLEHGYSGVAVMSYKNIEFLSSFLNIQPRDINFYYYGDTFLALTKSVKQLNVHNINQFEFDKQSSKLYLIYLLSKIYNNFNKKTLAFKEV